MSTRPLVVGIAGGTASGKTSVTEAVVDALDGDEVLVIAHDSYYRDLSTFGGIPDSQVNFDHPSSLETSLLISNLGDLLKGKTAHQPVYDFATYRRTGETRLLTPKPVIIVEGILIFVDKELRDLLDMKVFIDTDADERLLRRLKRDIADRGRSMDSVIQQYISTVKPMHIEFVEPSKVWADVIIPRGSENKVGIDVVISTIRQRLERRE